MSFSFKRKCILYFFCIKRLYSKHSRFQCFHSTWHCFNIYFDWLKDLNSLCICQSMNTDNFIYRLVWLPIIIWGTRKRLKESCLVRQKNSVALLWQMQRLLFNFSICKPIRILFLDLAWSLKTEYTNIFYYFQVNPSFCMLWMFKCLFTNMDHWRIVQLKSGAKSWKKTTLPWTKLWEIGYVI